VIRGATAFYSRMRPSVVPRIPERPLTVRHERICPEHCAALDDECRCPYHHTPDKWLIVRVQPEGEPVVVAESSLRAGLGPYIPGPTKERTKADRQRSSFLANTTFKLRRMGWSKAEARAEAERRWDLR